MFISHKNDIHANTAVGLEYFKMQRAISNDGMADYVLLDNICPHQWATIVKEPQVNQLVCPYHGRSWSLNGTSLKKECQSLTKYPVYEHCGLLFDQPVDFSDVFDLPKDFVLFQKTTQRVNASARTIMDVFLDVEHIPHAHAGVYEEIGITEKMKVSWSYYQWGSVQLAVEDQVRAVWIAVNPNTMIEWQPGAMFITQCIPGNTEEYTDVQIFQYKQTSSSETEFRKNKKIWDIAWSQDVEIAERIVTVPLFRQLKANAINS